MALHAHPTILSDLTQEHVFESDTGILHASSSNKHTPILHYCITTSSIFLTFTQDQQEAGNNIIYFTPFSSEAAWTRLYPKNLISNMISVRRTKTNPPTFLSLDSLILTSPTPETPPSHNSLPNPIFEPTKNLIALMQQSLQHNSAIMAHLHSCPPSPSALQPPPTPP